MENIYGDILKHSSNGCGVDISSQRIDDLELLFQAQLERGLSTKTVLDLGCGKCAVSNRLVQYVSTVIAVDIYDFGTFAHPNVSFIHSDLFTFLNTCTTETYFDYVICQRVLHYFQYSQAQQLLTTLADHMHPNDVLGLTVSGINSELGINYLDIDKPVQQRFCKLDANMQNKHHITEQVCLYAPKDVIELLQKSGFRIQAIWESAFQNIKVLASRHS